MLLSYSIEQPPPAEAANTAEQDSYFKSKLLIGASLTASFDTFGNASQSKTVGEMVAVLLAGKRAGGQVSGNCKPWINSQQTATHDRGLLHLAEMS